MPVFYLDENMPIQLAAELQAIGHQAVTTRDRGLTGTGDDAQLLFAAQQGWMLVTHDNDFLLLHDAWRRWSTAWNVTTTHGGIIIASHAWLAPQTAQEIDILMQMQLPQVNRLYEWDHQLRRWQQR